MIEAASALKLVVYFSLIACLFAPLGIAGPGARGGGLWGQLRPILAYCWCWLCCSRSANRRRQRCGCFAALFVGSAFAAAALAMFFLFVSKAF